MSIEPEFTMEEYQFATSAADEIVTACETDQASWPEGEPIVRDYCMGRFGEERGQLVAKRVIALVNLVMGRDQEPVVLNIVRAY